MKHRIWTSNEGKNDNDSSEFNKIIRKTNKLGKAIEMIEGKYNKYTIFKITITHVYFNSCTCITETIAEGEKAEATKNIPPAKKIESDNDGTSSDELGRQHDELPYKTIEMDPDRDCKHPPDTIVVKKVNSMLDREEEENLMRSPDSTALSHNSDQSNFLSNASEHFHKKQRKGSYPNV